MCHSLMQTALPQRKVLIHFQDKPLHVLQRRKTCPASSTFLEHSQIELGELTPGTPIMRTLDFWSCFCSMAMMMLIAQKPRVDALKNASLENHDSHPVAVAVRQAPTFTSGNAVLKQNESSRPASEVQAPGTTSPPAMPKQTVEGLDDVIASLSLQAHAADILHWCCNIGAAFLGEVAEESENLCDATALNEFERERVLAWAAGVIEQAMATTPTLHGGASVISRTVSQLPSSQQKWPLIRTDGPSTGQRMRPWVDFSDLDSEFPELEDLPSSPSPALLTVAGQKSCVRWANPLISVVEFCADDDDSDGSEMEQPLETCQVQSDFPGYSNIVGKGPVPIPFEPVGEVAGEVFTRDTKKMRSGARRGRSSKRVRW